MEGPRPGEPPRDHGVPTPVSMLGERRHADAASRRPTSAVRNEAQAAPPGSSLGSDAAINEMRHLYNNNESKLDTGRGAKSRAETVCPKSRNAMKTGTDSGTKIKFVIGVGI
ncbi:hypothetical protein EVAR_17866_1 [Eumeta japonica]|uniref:Uncharacterized protein n=1 Tax=Eumeta variegata TaxID=151549 RepID=A0A4C1ZLX9_EUMVA|nr:hypothetical protein EVAR_17866_1 [Eumeta japonica]